MMRLFPNCKTISRFVGDRHGVSAIEFAMVLPVLLAIFIGVIEFSRALDNRRKVSLLARTTSWQARN
jgi:Flp pilus assembly protein TadG